MAGRGSGKLETRRQKPEKGKKRIERKKQIPPAAGRDDGNKKGAGLKPGATQANARNRI
jgi:hypothetical protein